VGWGSDEALVKLVDELGEDLSTTDSFQSG